MPKPPDLGKRLQQLIQQKAQLDYHELRLEYPVLDLLPAQDANIIHLRKPQDSGFHRHPPNPSDFQWDTDFNVRLPLKSSTAMASSHSQSGTFLSTVTGLSNQRGSSLLQFVSYHHANNGVQHRFRLWTENQGQHQIVAESEFSDATWELESKAFQSEVWMQLIHNLMSRASDRAYLHVHQRLRLYSWYKQSVEQEKWGWEKELNVREVLASNLSVLVGNGQHVRTVEAVDLDGRGEGTVLLPCGYGQSFPIQLLGSFSAADCIEAACEVCDKKLLNEADLRRLCRFHESRRREQFYANQHEWKKLDRERERVRVSGAMLMLAMQDALGLLQVPESVSPKVFDLHSSKVVVDVLAAFRDHMRNPGKVVTCSTAELIRGTLADLEAVVADVLGATQSPQSLPPGWDAMVRSWVTRAVHLASAPDYKGMGFYGIKTEVERQSPQDRATMDELEVMLRSARLD